jgi:phosphomevalonate kinase
MDINKFKSVAVRKPDYDVLQGLCNQKFRSPASMISKLVNEYVEFQALKNKMTTVEYKEHILKMDKSLIGKEDLDGRSNKAKSNNSKIRKKLKRNTRKSR